LACDSSDPDGTKARACLNRENNQSNPPLNHDLKKVRSCATSTFRGPEHHSKRRGFVALTGAFHADMRACRAIGTGDCSRLGPFCVEIPGEERQPQAGSQEHDIIAGQRVGGRQMNYDILNGQHEENCHGQQMKWLNLEKPRLFLWLIGHRLTCSKRECVRMIDGTFHAPFQNLKWARRFSHGTVQRGPVHGHLNCLGIGLLGKPNVSGQQQSQDKQAKPNDSSMNWRKHDNPNFVSRSRQRAEKSSSGVRIGRPHCQREGQPATSFQIMSINADANHACHRSSHTTPIYQVDIDSMLRTDETLE
jgi:hypothetical protein